MAWTGRIVSALTALLLLQSVCGCSKEPEADPGAQAAHTPPKVKRKRVRPQGEEAAAAAPADPATAKAQPAPEPAKPAEAAAPALGAAPTESGAVGEAAPAGATPPAPGAEAAAAAPGAVAVAAAPGAAPTDPAAVPPAGAALVPPGSVPAAGAPAAADPADPAAGAPGATPGAAVAVPGADTQAADAARAAAEVAARGAAAAERPVEPAPDPAADAGAPIQAARLRGEAPTAEPALDLTGFLTLRDLENRLEKAPLMRHDDLPGIKPTQGYNAIYFAPAKGNAFGVALQVWRDPSLIDSRTRFNTQKNTASNAVDTQVLGDLAFRSYFGGVVSLTFVDARQPLVATLSCSVKLCNKDQFIALARTVAERMR